MILGRYSRGQPADIRMILSMNQPVNLLMAVKTISRIHYFDLEAAAAQHYSLNRVWHTAEPQAVEYKIYFHGDGMDSDNKDYISSR